MSIESVIPSNRLILCRPLLLPLSIFPSIRVFSKESVPCIRCPKYWSFSFSISPSNEYSGLIFFRIDWLDLLALGKHRTGDPGDEISSQFQMTPTWFLRMSCANPINSSPRVKLLCWLFNPYPRKVGLISRTGIQENEISLNVSHDFGSRAFQKRYEKKSEMLILYILLLLFSC